MPVKRKIAVILAAHGEAETTGILENYRVTMQTLGHASLVMPIPLPLQRFIAVTSSIRKRVRSLTNAQASPHNRITREQGDALCRQLNSSFLSGQYDFEVHAAFSASEPYVEKVIEKTRCSDAQVIVSMSPVDSTLSCGMLCSYLASAFSGQELSKVKVLSRFWSDEQLHFVILDHLLQNSRFSKTSGEEKRMLLLLLHGTLVTDKTGNTPKFRTGLEETMIFADRLRNMIVAHPANPYRSVRTVYLNHNVGGEWTKPSFEEICIDLQKEQAESVDIFACGYFADGNETIHRASELEAAVPVSSVYTIPCLNNSQLFTSFLASKVICVVEQIHCLSNEGGG
ncbi:MAG: ferrochelatase [Chlorobiaceae bacterium]|nr:ferrochelatase [Chlorobiaceae bacterium]